VLYTQLLRKNFANRARSKIAPLGDSLVETLMIFALKVCPLPNKEKKQGKTKWLCLNQEWIMDCTHAT